MEDGPDYDGPDYDYADPRDQREDQGPQEENYGYDTEGNRVVLRPGERIQGNYAYKQGEGRRWIGPEELDPDYVMDRPSQEILADLIALESGTKMSAAEEQTRELGAQLGTATHALSKGRRGITPGAAFSTAAQQSGLISNVTRTAADQVKKQVQSAAREDRLQFQAAKEAERRGIAANYRAQRAQAEMAAKQASAGLFGSVMSFLGSVGAALIVSFSDERLKTNVNRPQAKADLLDFLSNLDVASYDKHVFGHHRQETGIMAQSAERSKVGRQFVKEVKGYKAIDANAATGPILASLKLLHDRLDELEKPKKRKRSKK